MWQPDVFWCVRRKGSRADQQRRAQVREVVWLSHGWTGAWDPTDPVRLVFGAGERVAAVWLARCTKSSGSSAGKSACGPVCKENPTGFWHGRQVFDVRSQRDGGREKSSLVVSSPAAGQQAPRWGRGNPRVWFGQMKRWSGSQLGGGEGRLGAWTKLHGVGTAVSVSVRWFACESIGVCMRVSAHGCMMQIGPLGVE
jgi:hypothetical protein